MLQFLKVCSKYPPDQRNDSDNHADSDDDDDDDHNNEDDNEVMLCIQLQTALCNVSPHALTINEFV